jgi:hypothetical protein
LKRGLARVQRHWQEKEYDLALKEVEGLLDRWPGNAQLQTLWASLVQLQEEPTHSLSEVKTALQQAMDLDEHSPAAAIELGHYLDAVEDDPEAAARVFSEAGRAARRLLIEALVGQTRALLQLDKREEAVVCLVELMHLANTASSSERVRSAEAAADLLSHAYKGGLFRGQLRGPYGDTIESLLHELSATRSA